MSKLDTKRIEIFRKYSKQFTLLKQDNRLRSINQRFVGNYICPICLEHFSPKNLDQKLQNPLTLEDAPPKSLGGKANVLTCKNCNNNIGGKIDSHLSQRLMSLDKRNFLPNTESKVRVIVGNEFYQGTIKVDENRKMTMIQSKKNNHPDKLDSLMQRIGPGKEVDLINIEFLDGNFDPDRFQYALLKTAYLLAFEKFGYTFLLDPVYDRLRKQLLNPDKNIYPLRFWFEPPYPRELCGVHLITEQGLESIIVIFPVRTDHIEKIFAVILPFPFNDIDKVIAELNRRFDINSSFRVKCTKLDPTIDYLSEIEHMNELLNWLDQMKN